MTQETWNQRALWLLLKVAYLWLTVGGWQDTELRSKILALLETEPSAL